MLYTGRATRLNRSAVALGGLLLAAVVLLQIVRLPIEELLDRWVFEANPDDDLP